jgi:hypothetical protein
MCQQRLEEGGSEMPKQLVWLSVCIMLCVVVLTSVAGLAAIPHRINYQGRLTDSITGQPRPGTHTMQFRIYDVENLGTDLWSEEQIVEADTVGVVSVVLGSVSPIDILFDGRMWLEVEVDGEILEPRRELVSMPYAFHAMDSDSLGGLHSDSYSLVGHTHDDRYYTETELSTSDGSAPNTGLNAVHWDNLNGVPAGFADGVDNEGGGGAGDGYSLDADDGYPADVVYVDADGHVGVGTNQAERLLHVYDGSAGTVTSVDAAELVIEDDGNARINMLTPNNKSAGIDFGDPQDANAGWLTYNHTADEMTLGVSNADKVKIESDGDLNLNAGAGVAFADDNTKVYESTDDLYATADDDLYLTPDDDVYVGKDGSPLWARFDSDNQRLGLGTTSPAQQLHVAGNIRLNAGGDIEFGDANSRIYEASDDIWMTADDDLYLSPDDDIRIRADGVSDWILFDTGNKEVGIGTTTPEADLDILAGSWTDIVLIGADATNKLRLGSGSNWAALSGGSSNTNDLVIQHSTGRIGIGTTSPIAELHVTGSVDDYTGTDHLAYFYNSNANGAGLVARGGGNSNYSFPASGAGLAANGYEYGIYARADQTGNHGQMAIWTTLSGLSKTVRINYQSSGGTHYKINGDGLVSTTMGTSAGDVTLAAPESPEPWIDDYGSGEIVGGTCHVDLDPIYLDCVTINGQHPMRVFIELTSPLANQYYISKGTTGFDVIVVGGGAETASATFDYRVVGKWKGNEDFRFEPAEAPAELQTGTGTPVRLEDNE